MVLGKEEKEDVFADFHINRDVEDNENQLNRQEENEMHRSSQYVDGNVFAEFKLDKIIREHEDRLRREDAEKERAMAEEEEDEEGAWISPSDRNSFSSFVPKIPRLSGLLSQQRVVSLDTGREEAGRNQENRGTRWSSERMESASTRRRGFFQRKRRNSMLDRVLSGGSNDSGMDDYGERDVVELGDDGESTAAARDHTGWRTRKKHTNTSRSGTTVTATATIPEGEVYYDSSEEGFVSDDVEEGGDDNRNSDNMCPKRLRRDTITISKTGMPIGGMVATNKDSAHSSDYLWISPHSANEIFNEFDIDAIAEDYERLTRKLNFTNLDGHSIKELDDTDEEDNEHIIGIKVRYKNILNLWVDNFPRTHVIVFRIAVPIIVIILVTIWLGKLLAQIEWVPEINDNDAIMRRRHDRVDPLEGRIPLLAALPTLCFEYYSQQKFPTFGLSENSNSSAMNTIIESKNPFGQIVPPEENETSLSVAISKLANLTFPPVRMEIDPDPRAMIGEIEAFMNDCKTAVNEITLDAAKETKEALDSASQEEELTFHWMRCWNISELGDPNPFIPSKDQLAATWKQGDFYAESWTLNQTALYEQYQIEFCDEIGSSSEPPETECQKRAYRKSIEEATGSTMCSINVGASAWFWFVFMTTVGYGNVSPETEAGRTMVSVLGLFTIPIWAILLYRSGKVLGIVIDDLFRRCNLRFMTRNLPSVCVWAIISAFWILIIAEYYMLTQNFADNPDDYRFAPFGLQSAEVAKDNKIGLADAYWFSYISLLTVGLGDFSLPPEPFFLWDLLSWSIAFLLGFTYISTFLGQVADLTHNLFSDGGDDLKEALLNTNVVGRKEVQYKKENEKGIEKLEKLVEVMDDDDMELQTQRVTRIRVKKNLLIQLLYQTEAELEYYKKQGERYENLSYPRVCQEENMLNEILLHTTKEREKLESYQRSIADPASTLPDGEQKFFADGTTQDMVEEKLNLRQEKSAKKSLNASWYI